MLVITNTALDFDQAMKKKLNGDTLSSTIIVIIIVIVVFYIYLVV